MQLVITGDSAKGAEVSLSPQSVGIALGSHEVVRGNMPLPEGFTAPRRVVLGAAPADAWRALFSRCAAA